MQMKYASNQIEYLCVVAGLRDRKKSMAEDNEKIQIRLGLERGREPIYCRSMCNQNNTSPINSVKYWRLSPYISQNVVNSFAAWSAVLQRAICRNSFAFVNCLLCAAGLLYRLVWIVRKP